MNLIIEKGRVVFVKIWLFQFLLDMKSWEAALPGSHVRKSCLNSCTWRRQRLVILTGCDVRHGGGTIDSSWMSDSDKAQSDDHTVAATLVLLFPCGLRRRWAFLLLKLPDDSNQLMEGLVYIHTDLG